MAPIRHPIPVTRKRKPRAPGGGRKAPDGRTATLATSTQDAQEAEELNGRARRVKSRVGQRTTQASECGLADVGAPAAANAPPMDQGGRLLGAGYDEADREICQPQRQGSAGVGTTPLVLFASALSDVRPVERLREWQRQESADQAEARLLNTR